MGHKASTIEEPISSSSDVSVILHVVFDLHRFLLAGDVQFRATLGILLGAILIICPSHLIGILIYGYLLHFGYVHALLACL